MKEAFALVAGVALIFALALTHKHQRIDAAVPLDDPSTAVTVELKRVDPEASDAAALLAQAVGMEEQLIAKILERRAEEILEFESDAVASMLAEAYGLHADYKGAGKLLVQYAPLLRGRDAKHWKILARTDLRLGIETDAVEFVETTPVSYSASLDKKLDHLRTPDRARRLKRELTDELRTLNANPNPNFIRIDQLLRDPRGTAKRCFRYIREAQLALMRK